VSAIFISYTGRDDDGKPIAEQVAVWLREWGYESFFRDQELIEGIPAGRDWRQLLHARLAQCRLLIAVCSPKYEESAWCMAEVAIAMDRGHKLVPLVVGGAKLPLLLQNRQAITIQEPIELEAGAADEGPEVARRRIAAVQERLERALDDLLDWRAKMPRLADHTSPYPGLLSFDESTATVFYGRDEVIDALEKKVLGLPGHRSEFVLLQGASGSGKSSLLRAGLIPRLRNEKGQGFLVVDPFRLDLLPPLEALATKLGEAMVRDGVKAEFTTGGSAQKLLEDCARWRLQTQRQEAMVVVPIDQFEDLFNAADADGSDGKADQFLRFLADLLAVARGRVLMLATIRTDYLAVLESHQARLRNEGKKLRWSAEPIPPMDPALYSEVIEGPARQTGLTPEPGLTSALVADTGSGDALPLLAFTLKELWGYHAARGFQPEQVEGVGFVHLLRRDLTTIGGVSGSVSRKAAEVIKDCSEDELAALREAFLGHLVRISEEGEGGAAKQKAALATLPPASQELVKQLVEERLLVSDSGNVEIAHEALLRTWPTLVEWIKDGQEELLQRRRVKRLSDDLKPEAPERQRRQALEQLAGLAAAGGSEQRAVQKEGTEPLSQLLANQLCPEADREDAALVLALIGAEEPLRQCLANTEAPVALRRRTAESLGLVAKRSTHRHQRKRIADELEGLLRSDAIDLLVVDDKGWAEHDARLPLLQGASRGVQLAASIDLPQLGSGKEKRVPMLTLSALEEESGLRIRTEVIEVPVWLVKLPCNEFIEVVKVNGGAFHVGSPEFESGRNDYTAFRQEIEEVDVEILRLVTLRDFYIGRHLLDCSQWHSIVSESGSRALYLATERCSPRINNLWDKYAEPGKLPLDSIAWEDLNNWVAEFNDWEGRTRKGFGGMGSIVASLPSEVQWEVACRSGSVTPFSFGDTIDTAWALYDGRRVYGLGRRGARSNSPVSCGSYGIANNLGAVDMHGQLWEWCQDIWHRNPTDIGATNDEMPRCDVDVGLSGHHEQQFHVLKGGSWVDFPEDARAAFRDCGRPVNDVMTDVGARICFSLVGHA
jgi:formylglycine-generating enzyme required for sulfatase activity/energy-coupling factor transporter ATP-binding protein EcfA2